MTNLKTITNRAAYQKNQRGLTLLNCLICFLVIAVVTSIMVPKYHALKQKMYLSSMMQATRYYVKLVDVLQQTGEVVTRRDIAKALPSNIIPILLADENIQYVAIDSETGTLHITSSEQAGNYSLQAIPTINDGALIWNYGGSCMAEHVCTSLVSG